MGKRGRVTIPGRVPILLRIDQDLADWYKVRAAKQGRSRTMFVEQCLARFRAAIQRIDDWEKRGMAPQDVGVSVGMEFVAAMLELGVGTDLMRDAVDYQQSERRAMVAMLRKGTGAEK
jgi:predicted transcriptional regulator